MRKSIQELGDQQKAIMDSVWELGEVTAQQVLDRVNKRRGTKLAYTTILSALQKLEKNGWLRHRKEGRSYVYRANQSRADDSVRSLKKFTQRVFDGDPLLLFEHLMQDRNLTTEDLDALQKKIRQRRRELDR